MATNRQYTLKAIDGERCGEPIITPHELLRAVSEKRSLIAPMNYTGPKRNYIAAAWIANLPFSVVMNLMSSRQLHIYIPQSKDKLDREEAV